MPAHRAHRRDCLSSPSSSLLPFRLLAITPPEGVVDGSLASTWLEAGAHELGMAVLLREPHRSLQSILGPQSRLENLYRACQALAIPMLLSCNPDEISQGFKLCSDFGLAGLQLRGDPSPAMLQRARHFCSNCYFIGRSCHGTSQGGDAFVDYTCFAPVFAPLTIDPQKQKLAVGVGPLALWCQQSRTPVFALGGVDIATAAACFQAGAFGLAGIRSFFGDHEQISENVAAFCQQVKKYAHVSPLSQK